MVKTVISALHPDKAAAAVKQADNVKSKNVNLSDLEKKENIKQNEAPKKRRNTIAGTKNTMDRKPTL